MVAHNWNPSTWEMGEGSKVTAQAVHWRPINLREGGKHDQCTCARHVPVRLQRMKQQQEDETDQPRKHSSCYSGTLPSLRETNQDLNFHLQISLSFFEHLHLFHVCLWVCILARVEVKGQLAGICSLSVMCVLGSLQAVRLGSECCRPPERLACETYRIV